MADLLAGFSDAELEIIQEAVDNTEQRLAPVGIDADYWLQRLRSETAKERRRRDQTRAREQRKTEAMIRRLESAAEMYERHGRVKHAGQCRRRIAELEEELGRLPL